MSTNTNYAERIDALSRKFASFENLMEDELNLKASPHEWSLAQILEHLTIINGTYFPVLDALAAGTYRQPFLARFRFLAGMTGRFILRSVSPDRKRKIRTFPIWEPSYSHIQDSLPAFLRQQETLKQKTASCAHLFGKGIVISSPANRSILYTLDMAMEIILAHEERHYQQALEVYKRVV